VNIDLWEASGTEAPWTSVFFLYYGSVFWLKPSCFLAVQFMGVCIGSAVIPIAMSLTWAKCSAAGAMSGAIGGLLAAVATWMATAYVSGYFSARLKVLTAFGH
jgi:Na+/proline symporter